jgi:hypothetical protein
MQYSPTGFRKIVFSAALAVFSFGSTTSMAGPEAKRTNNNSSPNSSTKPVVKATPAPAAFVPVQSNQTARREMQAMLDYASSLNRAVQNIAPASDALGRMYGEATPDVLKLSASERAAIGNSWVASISRQTNLARSAFDAMGPAPSISNPDFQRTVNGFAAARLDILAVLARFDRCAERLSALVNGWTPERNDEVIAALLAERSQAQGEVTRAFAATNTAIAASIAPEAPSRNINLILAAMYNALATSIDARAGTIASAQAAQLIGQQTSSMRLQSPEGRLKVQALQARLRTGLGNASTSTADRNKLQNAIGAVGEYNKAFEIAERITNAVDQLKPLVGKNTEASLAEIDVIINNIGTLELELLDIVRNVSRRLAV